MRGTTLLPKLVAALILVAAIPAAARAGQSTDQPETRALALAGEREAKSAAITLPRLAVSNHRDHARVSW